MAEKNSSRTDWHEESRRVLWQQGPVPEFFGILEKEITDYMRDGLKQPLEAGSEIFPKKRMPWKKYGNGDSPVTGIPLPDAKDPDSNFSLQRCVFGNQVRDRYPRESQLFGGVHEVGHPLAGQAIEDFAKYLNGARKLYKNDPDARLPAHPVFGALDKETILKLDRNLIPQPFTEARSFFGEHLGERASDAISALFILSQYAGKNSPQREAFEGQKDAFTAMRAFEMKVDPQHYSSSTLEAVSDLHQQGKIPPHLSLAEARDLAFKLMKSQMPAIAQEYLALEDFVAKQPLSEIDARDTRRFTALKEMNQKRIEAFDRVCLPKVPEEKEVLESGMFLNRDAENRVKEQLIRSGVLKEETDTVNVSVNPKQGSGYKISIYAMKETPSTIAGGDPKFVKDKTLNIDCAQNSCEGYKVDYKAGLQDEVLPASAIREVKKAIDAEAEKNPLLKRLLQPLQ